MKRLLPLILIAAVLITGCDKSTVTFPTTASSSPIIGKWVQQSEVIVLYVSGKQVYQKNLPVNANNYTEYRTSGVVANYTYVSPGSYTETDGSFNLSSDNSSLTMIVQGYTQNFQSNFVNSNTLTLTGSGVSGTGVLTYTINGVTYQADAASAVITMTKM